MANESLQDPPAKSRQDQILLLAAEGMTDKEIASKLSLSPETVGTYWRRILSKYSAASRTEVVAKVVRLQAEASINEISEVNECLPPQSSHGDILSFDAKLQTSPDFAHFRHHSSRSTGILAKVSP